MYETVYDVKTYFHGKPEWESYWLVRDMRKAFEAAGGCFQQWNSFLEADERGEETNHWVTMGFHGQIRFINGNYCVEITRRYIR